MIRVRVGTDNMSADDIVVGFNFEPGVHLTYEIILSEGTGTTKFKRPT